MVDYKEAAKKGLVVGAETAAAAFSTVALGDYLQHADKVNWYTLGTVVAATTYVGTYFLFKK